MKVIFDTDPGIDDAMALLYLSKLPQIELLGITTVVGNASLDTTTRNALFLRQKFGISAPVVRGAGKTLDGVEKAEPVIVHGLNGLGEIEIPDVDQSGLADGEASQFIIDTVRAHPGEVTIIAVGRMTNLALALRADPEVARLTKQVIIMGGAFGYQGRSGNITPAAEANIHGDPVAADEIFAAEWPVVVVGLDVTHDIILDTDYLAALSRDAGENAELLRQMCDHYARFYKEIMGLSGVVGHDLLAVTYALHPEWFETRRGPIVVVRDGIAVGQTIQMPVERKGGHPAWAGRPVQTICTAVEGDKVLAHFRDTVAG
ncbi:Inosine-uridine nucleoside N-ribohydrolase [Devosia lucknowensis]|uniref:Inosine-uridine nucleoside N-ribohydrolase n=1 Tax=Devosia lucknowensis TaxID=1096929 RepID=A0A1Y6FH37_9HYPH|nr:nucleoside hydrolase [Devosia lucknowensis]SMQ72871.1 Inosine-uridine nucleoside N-ribohydrolase [Devosia lucknowensis]